MRRVQFPVLSGRTIPGKDPETAAKLREIAAQIEELADGLDDRYESPLPVPTYDDLSTTMTWTTGPFVGDPTRYELRRNPLAPEFDEDAWRVEDD